jgi:hypothetical protein
MKTLGAPSVDLLAVKTAPINDGKNRPDAVCSSGREAETPSTSSKSAWVQSYVI